MTPDPFPHWTSKPPQSVPNAQIRAEGLVTSTNHNVCLYTPVMYETLPLVRLFKIHDFVDCVQRSRDLLNVNLKGTQD